MRQMTLAAGTGFKKLSQLLVQRFPSSAMEKLVNEANAKTATGVRAESEGDAGSSATAPHGAGVSEIPVDANVRGRTGTDGGAEVDESVRVDHGAQATAETADEVTAEGIVDRWNQGAKALGVVGREGLSDEQKNYILGSGTWEEFDEAAKEVLDEINGGDKFSRRGTVAGQSSQHSGEHDETTRAVEKAIRADLRKKGQSTATETGFIHAEAVPDAISRLVKAVEKLFGVRVKFVSVSDPQSAL